MDIDGSHKSVLYQNCVLHVLCPENNELKKEILTFLIIELQFTKKLICLYIVNVKIRMRPCYT